MDIGNQDVAVLQAWLAVASDFTNLAVGALVLPIVFLRNILGVPEGVPLGPHISKFFYASWLFLFISIGLGMLYQAVATCYIGTHLVDREAFACQFGASTTFTMFTLSFFLGIGLFLLGAIFTFRGPGFESSNNK